MKKQIDWRKQDCFSQAEYSIDLLKREITTYIYIYRSDWVIRNYLHYVKDFFMLKSWRKDNWDKTYQYKLCMQLVHVITIMWLMYECCIESILILSSSCKNIDKDIIDINITKIDWLNTHNNCYWNFVSLSFFVSYWMSLQIEGLAI